MLENTRERDDDSIIRQVTAARSPSGKAKVCKTFIGGSIPPRASKMSPAPGRLQQSDFASPPRNKLNFAFRL
jgi:hypothetical protein